MSGEATPAGVHTLLGNRRRLLAVEYLSLFAPGSVVKVRHIARVVRGIEMNIPPRQVDADDYESAYNGLIQRHLPKLASKGLIEYDTQRKEVVVTERLDQYAFISAFTKMVASGDI